MANIMTCVGFDTGLFGGCSFAWLGIAILFFIVMLCRKWIGEEMGYSFNVIFAFVGAYLPYLIIVSLTASAKWALLGGIVGMAILGFGAGIFFGGSEDG
jgi:hypothetical protein